MRTAIHTADLADEIEKHPAWATSTEVMDVYADAEVVSAPERRPTRSPSSLHPRWCRSLTIGGWTTLRSPGDQPARRGGLRAALDASPSGARHGWLGHIKTPTAGPQSGSSPNVSSGCR